MMRIFLACTLLALIPTIGFPQGNNPDSTIVTADTLKPEWLLEMESYYYIVPGETNDLLFFGYADYNSLHFEARYNYEDKNTASIFGGYRFETGNKLVIGATPVAGVVFGNTNGIAPGMLLDLSYGMFDFYSESEYVFDFNGKENNFYYTWNELAITPFENFRTGLSANRTRLYQTGLEIQRGLFAQYTLWHLTGGLHYFNPFTDEYFFIATLGVEF